MVKRIFFIIIICLFGIHTSAQSFTSFKQPSDSNRVITYWVWMNGHITKTGITKDLEAMKAAGINGTLLFSAGYYPAGPVKFMSNDWWDDVAYAMKESDRLNMSFGVYNSDGWSMSGGPWITPEESMKELVWADTLISGGNIIQAKLPQPLTNLIYHDISIQAFPALKNNQPLLVKKVISATLIENPQAASDNNAETYIHFFKSKRKDANIVLDFGQSKELRRVVFDNIKANPFLEAYAQLEYSLDGKNYIKIENKCPLNLKAEGLIKRTTYNFSKITARYIRLNIVFESSTKNPVPISQKSIALGEIHFYASPRINLWEPKSGETMRIRHERQQIFRKELDSETAEDLPSDFFISSDKIINLTKKVDKNGILNWDAPDGEWVIQRVGFTSTNRQVHPATKEGEGLECDKMDARAVEKHFNAYTGKIIDLSNKILGKPINCIQLESWEAGIQNWTKDFEIEFQKRNGYSLLPYLPVLAGGYVVNSYKESNKFLWDFRNTVSRLIAENYWGTMYRCAKSRGVTISGEGSGMQHYLYDPIRYQKYLDIPMGEFWPNEDHVRADIKNASSVAHTYGYNLAGAEAFTSGYEKLWSVTPYDLKQIGDEAFAFGINHFVLHTYVHQPYEVAPGFTLKKFGNHLQRLNPWYIHAQGWFNYLARCQYVLRQGKSIQDIAYFTGEGIPGYLGLPWELHPKLPKGYDYDGVNVDLIKQMEVKNGKLYLPSGACYRVLVFQDINFMTPELITQIKRLVADGGTVVSAKPIESPSLEHGQNANIIVKKIADEVWGNLDGKKVYEHDYGDGRVYYGIPLDKILKELNVLPDFTFKTNNDSVKINFTHKKTTVADNYFLANYRKSSVHGKGIFRISNKVPELWDPDKGTVSALPFCTLNKKQIEIPLDFDPLGAIFITFKDTINEGYRKEEPPQAMEEFKVVPLDGKWDIYFQSNTDTFKTVFKKLSDWSESENDRIKYFSGTAVYSKTFQIKKIKNVYAELDLGDVNKNTVTVLLNGHKIANLWKPPYLTDITSFLNNGKNHLKIKVTNTATNSLIGDERFAPDLNYDRTSNISEFPSWLEHPEKRPSKRKTFVTYKYLNKNSDMDPSGMLGPVYIRFLEFKKNNTLKIPKDDQ